MKKLLHFSVLLVFLPFIVSLDLVKCIVKFFKNDDLEGVYIPIPNTLTKSWNDLIKQLRISNLNKKSSLYPPYFFYFETEGFTGAVGKHSNYGSFIDPSGEISEYDYSERFNKEVKLPFTNILEERELNKFIEDFPEDSINFDFKNLIFDSIGVLSQEVSRQELLKFIDNLKKKDTEHNFKINLDEVIRDITESQYTLPLKIFGPVETPLNCSYILVYDETKDTYKRIVLELSGADYLLNNSPYISKLNSFLDFKCGYIRDEKCRNLKSYFDLFKDTLTEKAENK